jgi:hypothetical protein
MLGIGWRRRSQLYSLTKILMEPWKIEIQQRPAQFLTDIWIYRRSSTNKIIIYRYRDHNVVEEEEAEYGAARLPATLTIPNDLVPLLLDAIVNEGIKAPAQTFKEGKLAATEAHLKDLRYMLKMPRAL